MLFVLHNRSQRSLWEYRNMAPQILVVTKSLWPFWVLQPGSILCTHIARHFWRVACCVSLMKPCRPLQYSTHCFVCGHVVVCDVFCAVLRGHVDAAAILAAKFRWQSGQRLLVTTSMSRSQSRAGLEGSIAIPCWPKATARTMTMS